MIVGPNCEPKHIVDVFLNGLKLEGPFWADTEAGEVWVDVAPFARSKAPLRAEGMPYGYSFDGAAVVLLRGNVQVILSPEIVGLTMDEAIEVLDKSDKTIALERITKFSSIKVMWPDDRDKFERTNLFCNDDILDVLHRLKYYNSCGCVRCEKANHIMQQIPDLGCRAGFGCCVYCGAEAVSDDSICEACKSKPLSGKVRF